MKTTPGAAEQYQTAGAERDQASGGMSKGSETRTLPLDAYIFERPGQTSVDTQAQQLLAQKCIQRFGLEYAPPDPMDSAEGLWEKPLGVESEAEVKMYGYQSEPRNLAQEDLSVDVIAVAFGNRSGVPVTTFAGRAVPDGGCFGEARRQLAESLPPVADEQYALKLAHHAAAEAEGDARLQDAFVDWSRCMKKAGYDYARPQDPLQDEQFKTAPEGGSADGAAPQDDAAPHQADGTRPPSPLEIATAVADVRCKDQTGLLGTWTKVVSEYQQRELDEHSAALAELKMALEARYKRAAEIVNGG